MLYLQGNLFARNAGWEKCSREKMNVSGRTRFDSYLYLFEFAFKTFMIGHVVLVMQMFTFYVLGNTWGTHRS